MNYEVKEMLAENKKYTYEEFLEITKDIERAEFIDGEIIMQATPTAQHQSIVLNIASELKNALKNKKCRPYIAPFDIILESSNEDTKRVQPDISIICNENLTTENKYIGVPTLLVEVVSPSNASDDYIKKLNLYMRVGVKEYWIVSPKNKTIEIFKLENGIYGEPNIISKNDIVESGVFEEIRIALDDIFN